MANNPYVNKVVKGTDTLIDLTADTVTANSLMQGYTAHDASGAPVTGSIVTKSSSDLTASGATVTAPAGYYATAASKSVASGSVSASATKSISNHTATVTPSASVTAGYISSGATGTAVTVSASELVSGTKSITSNGTSIDVAAYATVDVSVSGSDMFVVTVSYNDQTEKWEPDCTYADILQAGRAEKTATVQVDVAAADACADGSLSYWPAGESDESAELDYWVRQFTDEDGNGIIESRYVLASSGLTLSETYSYSEGGASPNLQSKTNISPTTSSQTITPDSGYDGLSSVTVNAIPSEYIVPSGSQTLTSNNTYDVTSLASVVVNVAGSSWELITSQTLTDVSTTSTSTATAGTIALGSTAFTKDDIIWVHVRDTAGKRAGYFYGSDAIFVNANKANGSTSTFTAPGVTTIRYSTSSVFAAYTGAYGVWGYSITSGGSLTVRKRYNSNYSLTVNGDYKVDVYKLTPPSGMTLFT